MTALDKWLTDQQIQNAAFAKTVGSSESSISRIRRGVQIPSRGLIRRIVDAAGGAVTPSDLLFPKGEVSPRPEDAATFTARAGARETSAAGAASDTTQAEAV